MKTCLLKMYPTPLKALLTVATLFGLAQIAGAQGVSTWSGAGADQNWSTPGNWTAGTGASAPPGTGDTAVFGNVGFGAIGATNNIVTINTTIGGLSYTNVNPNSYTTQINPSVTLTVNGTVTVGFAGSATTDVMAGSGNFTVNNVAGNFNIGGAGGSTETVTFTLADGTNTITAKTFSQGESASNNGRQCTLNLGAGPTFINADSVNMGTGKGSATIQWPAAVTNGTLTIRDHTGTGRANLLLGNGTSGSGACNGRLLLAGHSIDILATNMIMGRLGPGTDSGNQVGTVLFDTGTIDTTSMLMGSVPSTATSGTATGTVFTVGGNTNTHPVFTVNSPTGPGNGTFIISGSTNAAAGRTGSGTFIISSNGTANIFCPVVKALAANNTATFNITNGLLNMEAATNTIGTPTAPINNVSLSSATLHFFEDGSSVNISALNLNLDETNVFNIDSLPVIGKLGTSIPLITYTPGSFNSDGNASNLVLNPLPGGFGGFLTNDQNGGTISLVITSGTIITKADEWGGAAGTNWDTVTLNWTNAGVAVKYADGDSVTFDDLASTNIVSLVGTRSPNSFTVNNNTLNYTFNGIGRISGLTSLVKSGGASVMLASSGGDNFSGGIALHGGTLILDDANGHISGGFTNDPGTVAQIGNNDANGALPSGSVLINGSLVFNQTNNQIVPVVLAGTGSLTQGGSNVLTITNVNTYTGNTFATNGTLLLGPSGNIVSPLIFIKNAAFDISTSVSQQPFTTVSLTNGTLVVGTNLTAFSFGTLTASNATISIAVDVNNAGGTPTLSTTTLTTGGTSNNITITAIANLTLTPTFPTIIPLISYGSASFSSGFNFGVTVPVGIGGFISNNVAGSTIVLVITNAPQTLTWNGGSATDNNWSDAANWTGTAISPLDALAFDGNARTNNINDSAVGTTYSAITFNGGAGTFALNGNSLNLSGTMLNNSGNVEKVNLGLALSNNCTLDGGASGGSLVINGGVTNTSAGTRTVTLQGNGTIIDLFATNSGVNGGGQLAVLAGGTGGEWMVMDGTGTGALVQAGNLQLGVGGTSGTLDYGTTNSAPNLDTGFTNGGNLSINGTTSTFNMNNGTIRAATMNIASAGTVAATFNMNGGTIILGTGSFNSGGGNGGSSLAVIQTNGSIISTNGGNFTLGQRSTGTYTISGGLLQCGTLNLTSGTAAGANGTFNLNGGTLNCTNVTVGSGGANGLGTLNFNGGTLQVGSNSTAFFKQNNLAPLNTIDQAGGAIINTAGFSTTLNLPLVTDPALGGAPDGGLTKLGAGTLTLNGVNTYIGNTAVNNGTLLVTGSLSNGSVTVAALGTLAGTGIIGGPVTVNGTIAPGTAAVGTLTVTASVGLQNNTLMKLNGATNDVLSVAGTLTYGGTLTLSNSGAALTLGSTYRLFSATTIQGSFTSLSPATPGAGLLWNTNNLGNGILSITNSGVKSKPTLTSVSVKGATLSISATNGTAGGTFVLLSSTNAALKVSLWTPVLTNAFDANGNITLSTNIISPAVPTEFFLLSQ